MAEEEAAGEPMSEPINISDLTLDPKNPRKRGPRAEGMLVASLQEVGAARSIVVDEDGRVLAGNGTVQAAAEAGIERVQVVDADGETLVAVRRRGLTEAQKRRLSVLDNRTGELAEWDAGVLAELAEDGLKLDDLWSDEELIALLDGAGEPHGLLTDPDAIPDEADVETRCKPGDLWRSGKSTWTETLREVIPLRNPASVWRGQLGTIAVRRSTTHSLVRAPLSSLPSS